MPQGAQGRAGEVEDSEVELWQGRPDRKGLPYVMEKGKSHVCEKS